MLRNVVRNLEGKIKQAFYKDEEDAENVMRQRRLRRGLTDDVTDSNEESDIDEPINTSPNGYEEEDC